MSSAAISERFGQQIGTLPGGAASAAVRRAALQRFEELGFPHRRIETWHYTDLSSLADREFDYLGETPDAAALAAAGAELAKLDLDAGAPCCVFVDGYLVPALSSFTGFEGLSIATLTDVPGRLLTSPDADRSALEALNTAFAHSGILMRISQTIEQPIHFVSIGARSNIAAQQKLRFELAPGAGAQIMQYLNDLDDAGDSWLNQVIEIDQGASSALELYRLQQLSGSGIQTTLTRAALADHARLTTRSIELGGATVRHEILVALNGDDAQADMTGLTLTHGQQHADSRIAIEHAAPHTTSRQEFRALAGGKSRSVFNGKVTVQKQAQHIEARQRNDNLLLSHTAEIDTKPELEIHADQVICSHGATVGELSEDHLFYLRARGIDEPSARNILTAAFAEIILSQIGNRHFQDRAREAVQRRLPRS